MEVLFIILPLAILMAATALAAFYWSVHRGQLDDLDTPRYRMLFDDAPAVRSANVARTVTNGGDDKVAK